MLLEVAIVSALLAGAGWGYLRWSRRSFDRKYGKIQDPEPDVQARVN